jgi:hypothetical protein
MKIEQMTNRNGHPLKNQFIIYDDSGNVLFQSYKLIIARRNSAGKITLDGNWDYSTTTGKYRNIFLGESKQETSRKLKQGIYTLENLNR